MFSLSNENQVQYSWATPYSVVDRTHWHLPIGTLTTSYVPVGIFTLRQSWNYVFRSSYDRLKTDTCAF